jgi:hypothetical protein
MSLQAGQRQSPHRWLVRAGVSVAFLALIMVLFWTWFSAGANAFIVDCVPFRQWVSRNRDFEIRDPLAKLGTNAVPYLIRILRRRPEPAWSSV